MNDDKNENTEFDEDSFLEFKPIPEEDDSEDELIVDEQQTSETEQTEEPAPEPVIPQKEKSKIDSLEFYSKTESVEPEVIESQQDDRQPSDDDTSQEDDNWKKYRGRITGSGTFEIPPEGPQPDIKPWEIDERGVPLKDKARKRELTAYEKWLNEKRKKEGNEVICPQCGALNIELPFVSGEKCSECGFNLDLDEDVVRKMRSHDEKTRVSGSKRLRDDSLVIIKKSLALPPELVNDPDLNFVYRFRSNSYIIYLIFIIGSLIWASVLFMASVSSGGVDNGNSLGITILLLIAVGAIFGFVQATRVTRIHLDKETATFHSCMSTTQIRYDKITNITTDRAVNGRARMFQILGFLPFFFFAGRHRLGLYYYGSRIDNIYDSNDMVTDNSSTSRVLTNNVTISSTDGSVSYSFCGADNRDFIQALAIIIFMAKRKNKNLMIPPSVIKAAEKGHEFYQQWQLDRSSRRKDPDEWELDD